MRAFFRDESITNMCHLGRGRTLNGPTFWWYSGRSGGGGGVAWSWTKELGVGGGGVQVRVGGGVEGAGGCRDESEVIGKLGDPST